MKAIRTAALVVGAVALVATGAGAAAGVGIGLGLSASTLATIATVAKVASFAAGALSVISAVGGAPKGSVGGSATQFKIDKEAGQPVAIGRTYSGGNVAHRQYYGSKNAYESWLTIHSIGPVRSLGPLLIDKVAQALNGTAVGGSFAGYMWLDQQLGACPEGRSLTGPQGGFPGWYGSPMLSGLAADLWTLKFDEKGKVYPNGVPQRGRIVEGVYVYDPRLDSTYPGGSGSCRINDASTWVWSENPALHAISWAYGHYQNGVLVAGGGLQVSGIDLPPFVDWANVCDVNRWTVGGIVYTNSDNSWDILKMIAQAGGGEVMPVGAQLSCTFSAPRVSIGAITSEDIIGDVDVPASASRRLRRNTVIPTVRLESHGWEQVPLDAIAVPDYITSDGGSRPKEVAFPLVQQVDQGAQLGLYDIVNARELDGIVLPAKVYAIGYRPGDCLTVDIPEASLLSRDVVVRNREIDGSSMGVTLTCRSETRSKHAFCLGKTGKAPPTPDLSVPPSYPVGAQRAAYSIVRQSVAYPIDSSNDTITAQAFEATIDDGRVLSFPGQTISGLASGTTYIVLWDLTASTFVAFPSPALEQVASSNYVLVREMTTANTDGTYPSTPTAPGGDGGGGYGGGYCVTTDTLILMADGSWRRAGDLCAGDRVRTRHEHTFEWGVWEVAAAGIVRAEVMGARGYPTATPDHRFWTEQDGWFRMAQIGTAAGLADVVKITVAGAHTYVSRHPDVPEGVLSHNIKQIQQNDA